MLALPHTEGRSSRAQRWRSYPVPRRRNLRRSCCAHINIRPPARLGSVNVLTGWSANPVSSRQEGRPPRQVDDDALSSLQPSTRKAAILPASYCALPISLRRTAIGQYAFSPIQWYIPAPGWLPIGHGQPARGPRTTGQVSTADRARGHVARSDMVLL